MDHRPTELQSRQGQSGVGLSPTTRRQHVKQWILTHLQIHKAPCKGLRTCQSVELDSDCHFDLRRQFVCPEVNSDGHPLDERKYGTVREVMFHAATRHTDYIGDIAHIHGKLRRKRPRDR